MCYSFLATIMSDHTSWLLLFVPDSLENLKSRVTRKKGRGFGGMLSRHHTARHLLLVGAH